MYPFKKVIYVFLKKNKFFSKWKEELIHFLKGKYKFKIFYNFKKFLSAVLFEPPSMVIYYYHKNPKGLNNLVELRKRFNMFNIPLILILDHLDLNYLIFTSEWGDDFIFLDDKIGELFARIEYAFHRLERISDNNPLTGLPGNTSIYRALERILNINKHYAVAYVDLDNFKAYNDAYGFSQGDEMIKSIAKILVTTISDFSREDYFIGHIGGDDFIFIVPLEKSEPISKEIIKRFDTLAPTFLNQSDKERGYFISIDRVGNVSKIPIPSLSISIVPVVKGKFKHVGEISARLAEVKKVVKEMKGSKYFIDRRK